MLQFHSHRDKMRKLAGFKKSNLKPMEVFFLEAARARGHIPGEGMGCLFGHVQLVSVFVGALLVSVIWSTEVVSGNETH